jgi:hypothetical protein
MRESGNNNKQHGHGKMISSSGKEKKGKWENGKLIGK